MLPSSKRMLAEVVDSSCKAAVKFVNTYYDFLDNKRNLLPKLYGDNAVMLWNGNPFQGSPSITEFLTSFPDSKHKILSFDAQPILQGNVLLQVSGSVSYPTSQQQDERQPKAFSQSFILLPAPGGALNHSIIASDTFRFV